MRPEVSGKKPSEADASTAAVERQTYSIEEAAKILGICRALAYRPGVLPTVKIAGRRLVPKQALDRLLAKTA
jgi:hypothetical protein